MVGSDCQALAVKHDCFSSDDKHTSISAIVESESLTNCGLSQHVKLKMKVMLTVLWRMGECLFHILSVFTFERLHLPNQTLLQIIN